MVDIANKWRERYHSQVRINEQLENQRSLLKDELENERIKMTKGDQDISIKLKLRLYNRTIIFFSGWSKIPHTNDLNDDISEVNLEYFT